MHISPRRTLWGVTIATAAAAAMFAPRALWAQQGLTVTGTVKNAAGSGVGVATVAIPSLGVGAQTNGSGDYTVAVPAARLSGATVTIIVRGVGYKPDSAKVQLVAGTKRVDFILAANPLRLGEVVVTGAGTSTTRERLGTVVNSVKSEDIQKSGETNIVNALAAKAPGIEITSQAGDPGAGAGIIIRGFKTIEGNGQPLFVVDGMPIDNSTNVTEFSDVGITYSNRASDINPNDIESIEVLNGAAASGIYGLRAANGVILITTKSGRAGQTRYSLNSTVTVDQVNRKIQLQTLYGRGTNSTYIPEANCPTNGNCQLRSWGGLIPAGTPIYDHTGEIMRNGGTYDNSLSVSGGDATRTFFLSAGSTNQKGMYNGPNNYYNRYTVHLKASQQLTDNLRVGGNVTYADVAQVAVQKGNNLNGLLLGAARQPAEFNSLPYITPAGYQRSWQKVNVTQPFLYQQFDNPFWSLNQQNNFSRVGRTIGNIAINYFPTSWLTFDYTLGADYSGEQRTEGLPPYSAGTANTGQLYQGQYQTLIIDHLLLATANFELNKNASLKFIAGQNLNATSVRQEQLLGTTYIDPGLSTLNNTISTNLAPQNYESSTNIAGYFGSAEGYFADQLTINLGVRADQSSALGANNRTATFPRASVAWVLSNFLGNKSQKGTLSYAKLRASYGEVGRAPFPYQIFSSYSGGTAAFAYGTGATNATQAGFGGLLTGFVKGDPNLKFERTKSQEIGLDFGLFDQRIDGQITSYNEKTTDVIFSVPLAPSTGYGSQVTNGGIVSNKGIELSINGRVVDEKNLRWEIGGTWSKNKNMVDDLKGATFLGLTGGFGVSYAVKGYPLGEFYGSDFVRCRLNVPDADNTLSIDGASVNVNAACRTAGAKDGAMYIAANKFPRLDANNYALGNPNPDWLGGLRSSVTLFRKFTVSALLDIKQGGQVWNGTRGALQSYGTSIFTADRGTNKTFGVDYLPGATFGPGSGQAVPVGESWYRTGIGNNFNGPTSQFVEDGSYKRLREVSIAYSWDSDIVRRTLGLSSVNVRLAGRNLFLWTKYNGVDPMTNLTGPIGAGRGIDYFNNPQSRSWVVNVTLNR